MTMTIAKAQELKFGIMLCLANVLLVVPGLLVFFPEYGWLWKIYFVACLCLMIYLIYCLYKKESSS